MASATLLSNVTSESLMAFTFTSPPNSVFDPNTNHSLFGMDLNFPYWYNISFLLNISRDIPEQLGVVMFGQMLPFLLVLTFVTNMLIVAVLSQAHMRTPTNLVLLMMAIADLLTLALPSPWYIYLYSFNHYREALYPPLKCYIFHYMYEVLPALFHTYSIWLTLLLAGQRYVYVCHFSAARTWCTVPQVSRAMLLLLLCAVLHQITRFFDRKFYEVHFVWNNQVVQGCQYLSAEWVGEFFNEDIYYIIYYVFRIIFVHFGPCISLVLLNVLLFRALHRTQQARKRLLGPKRCHMSSLATPQTTATATGNSNHMILAYVDVPGGEEEDDIEVVPGDRVIDDEGQVCRNDTLVVTLNTTNGTGQQHQHQHQCNQNRMGVLSSSRLDSHSTTIMLIVIVSVFLMLEIPLAITTLLHLVQNACQTELVDYDILNTVILITNFFIILSYPINFAIYCGMSRQFRQTFRQLFLDRFCLSLKQAKKSAMDDPMHPERTNVITGASSSTFGVTTRSNATLGVLGPELTEITNARSGTSCSEADGMRRNSNGVTNDGSHNNDTDDKPILETNL